MRKIIVVVGPTAVGKTKISIALAKHYNLEIISGDSVSIYKELDIGSAKPTLEEMAGIKHHLLDCVDLDTQYSVCDFQREARKLIDKNDVSLICGGTGLYIQSVLFDYEFQASRRDEDFDLKYENYSNEELYSLLVEMDPKVVETDLVANNRKRVLRALEICQTAGPYSSYNNKSQALYDYYIVYLNISSREKLYERINARVLEMMDLGLENEVRNLYSRGIKPNAIGYKEFIPYFNGECELPLVIENIQKNTRHLAKRQITWFKNQMNSTFYDVDLANISNTIDEIIADLDKFLEK